MANILVVEPNRLIQQSLVPLLERGGYSVCVVSSGAEARQAIRQHSHDLILLSAALLAREGESLLLHLIDEAPVVVIAQHKNTPEEIAALTLGAVDYIADLKRQGVLMARIRVALRYRYRRPLQ